MIVYEQRDTSVPIKHHAYYTDRGNWCSTKTRNIHRAVYIFKHVWLTTAHYRRCMLKGVVISMLCCSFILLFLFSGQFRDLIPYGEKKMDNTTREFPPLHHQVQRSLPSCHK